MSPPTDISPDVWAFLFDALTDRLMARLEPALAAVLAERQTQPQREAFSVTEAAAALGLSADTIRAEIAAGTLRAVRFGAAWRIARTDLEARLLATDNCPRVVALPSRGRPRKAARS